MDLSRRDAERIAAKLGAEKAEGRKHTVVVLDAGKEVARYNIRRGPNSAHNFLPRQLSLTPPQTTALARCEIIREEYFDICRQGGRLL
jgi:hypothetical protein